MLLQLVQSGKLLQQASAIRWNTAKPIIYSHGDAANSQVNKLVKLVTIKECCHTCLQSGDTASSHQDWLVHCTTIDNKQGMLLQLVISQEMHSHLGRGAAIVREHCLT
jgi:invasion protein IalB